MTFSMTQNVWHPSLFAKQHSLLKTNGPLTLSHLVEEHCVIVLARMSVACVPRYLRCHLSIVLIFETFINFISEHSITLETSTRYVGIPGETATHSRCRRRTSLNVNDLQRLFRFGIYLSSLLHFVAPRQMVQGFLEKSMFNRR